MTIFKWDSSLESGIELVDSQHKQIFEAANAFFISYKCGNASKKAQDSLAFLEQYILYHFQAEEAFQSEIGYPKYREHQAYHEYLATQVKFHAVNLGTSDFAQEAIDAFRCFICEWIVKHILEDDLDFSCYYRQIKQ